MTILLRMRNFAFILGLSLIAIIFVTATDNAVAQKPRIPVLSLLGQDNGYEKSYYPDGRIWVPPSLDETREFLVPVFIFNQWFSYKDAFGNMRYVVKPITSFDFSLFYDESAVRAIGVETIHPSYMNFADDDQPLANGWTIDIEDAKDNTYWEYFNPSKPITDKEKGRRVKIAGTSITPLPNTDLFSIEYKILLYVRFQVITKYGSADLFNKKTPMYLDTRVIRYNDLNVCTQRAYEGMLDYDIVNYKKDYGSGPVPVEDYLNGLNNAPVDLGGPMQTSAQWDNEPYLPGSTILRFSDDVPEFKFTTFAGDNLLDHNPDKSEWYLDQIVTVDENSTAAVGSYKLKIDNNTTNSRLSFIEIETDEPWLTIKCDNTGGGCNKWRQSGTRNATINYIDETLLGQLNDPMDKETVADRDVYMEIVADPSKLKLKDDGEKTGLHIGYITLKSPFARVSPVKIKVMFLYIKNPYEPDFTKLPGNPGGINLNITNAKNQGTNLVFGTGERATMGVDNLFGEFAHATPLRTTVFDARWYVWNNPSLAALIPNGFGDFAPNVGAPRTNSRDIKPYPMPNGVNSYTYYCKFNANGPNAYPVTIEYNTDDFPVGSTLYIRDVLNGQLLQATNMRESTPTGATTRAYSIIDPRITEFVIEYTLPTSIDFINADGSNVIKRGWNLLSLPLRPANTKWNNIYTHALNTPLGFFVSGFEQVDNLQVGVGYFVKYSNEVDRRFSGAMFNEVTVSDKVRVAAGDAMDPNNPGEYGGWNMVGSLSTPTAIGGIEFEKYATGSVPNRNYTFKFNVYGYNTDKGYYAVSEMLPGLGYFIKVNTDGYYMLKSSKVVPSKTGLESSKDEVYAASSKIIVKDNAQRETAVYMNNDKELDLTYFELPPTPPAGLFDVRLNNNKFITNSEVATINLQGVNYPLSLSVDNADADYIFIDPVTEKELGTIKAGTNGEVVLNNLPANAVKVMKVNAVIEGFGINVYPNPAMNNTVVSYSVVNSGNVKVVLFDALGNEVMTLVDGNVVAGSHTVNLNVEGLSVGNYICKITSGNMNSFVKVNVVR